MRSPFTVRRAVLHDAPAIAAIQVRTWQTTYRGIVPDAFLSGLDSSLARRIEQWRATIQRPAPYVTLVGADEHGLVVGYAGGGPDRGGSPAVVAELYAIYILPQSQGRGVGRSLLTRLAEELRTQRFSALNVWVLSENESARRFYARFGARPVGAKTIEIGGRGLEATQYLWDSLDALAEGGQLRADS